MITEPCEFCGRMIFWANDHGHQVPIDVEPVMFGGNIDIIDGCAVVMPIGQGTYMPHATHCEKSRKRRVDI